MITVNLFIYETERKCDMQKRLGARKTTLLPKLRRAVLLPCPPEPLPLGSLRNRDVDFWRIHKLPHHRGKKKIRMEGEIWGLFCAEECFGSEWVSEIGPSCWSEVTKMRKWGEKKTQPEILQLFWSFWSPGQCCKSTSSANAFCCPGILHPRLAEAIF